MVTGLTPAEAFHDLPDLARSALGELPEWLWDVDAGRIVFANAAGVRFFGETDLPGLQARAFDPDRPAMQQLRRVAAGLPDDGSPRLGMLRFFVGLRGAAIACACRMAEAGGRQLVIVSATGGNRDRRPIAERAAMLFDAEERPVTISLDGEIVYRNPAASDLAPETPGDAFDVPFGEEVATLLLHREPDAAPTGAAPSPATAHPAARAGGHAEPQRFSFVLDAEGRFLDVGPGLASVVGPANGEVAGRYWADVAAGLGLDPEGRVAAALLRQDTWSGVTLDWPREGGGHATVRLAALPRFGDGRIFAGYRGFGDVMEVTEPEPAPVEEPREPEAAAFESAAEDEIPQPEPTEGTPPAPPQDQPAAPPASGNVHTLRPSAPVPGSRLNERERTAFEQIAHALGARMPDEAPPAPADEAPASEPGKEPETTEPAAESTTAEARQTDAGIREEADEALASPEEEPGEEPAEEPAGEPLTADRENDRDFLGDDFLAEGETFEAEEAEEDGDALDFEDWLDLVDPPPGEAPPAGPLDIAAAEIAAGDPHDRRTLALVAETAVTDALDRLPLGVAVTRDDRVLYANRAFLELFDFADLDDLEVGGGLAAIFRGHSANEGTAVAAQRRDGTPVIVESRLGRLPWPGGPAMFVTAWETTARAAPGNAAAPVPAETSEEVAELRAILDTATDGVLVLSAEGLVESVNGSAEAVFGYRAEEMVGKPFAELVSEESRAAVEDYLDGLASGGVASVLNDGREVHARARGGEVPLFLTIGRLGERQPPRFCAVIRDLTDWKAAEAELVEARRKAESASAQKSDFLAKMSHEIRTPLNAIIGFAEVILEERMGNLGTERYRDYVRDIRASGEHIMSLVNDLLDLSKIEAGKLELSFTGVNLNDIVEQSVAIMQPQANRERIIIRTSLVRRIPLVVADVRSLRQVMLNLLSNAIKFTPPGGQAIVSTVIADSGEVMLRIRDTGVGMSETDIQTAMEPFRQLAVRSTRHKGTGLGLPLTRALVEANRASFAIRSRVNEGTLVEVAFPQSRVLAE